MYMYIYIYIYIYMCAHYAHTQTKYITLYKHILYVENESLGAHSPSIIVATPLSLSP